MNKTGGRPTFLNPFQQHMQVPEAHLLNQVVLEAPLPLAPAVRTAAALSSIHGIFHFSQPPLRLVALEGESTTTEVASRGWRSLIYIADGEIYLHQHNALLDCSAGDCLLVPEGPAIWESSPYSVVCLMFSPQQLSAGLMSLRSQDPDGSYSENVILSKPCRRKASDGLVEASLLKTLQHLLLITNELASSQPTLLTHLGITNQLCLVTALLWCPSISTSLHSDTKEPASESADEAIEELTNYMLAHLSEPINLSSLEKFSHYSRRSLQYAFRRKFGCTITQWIRYQRLDLAYQKFKTATKSDTVASIAQSCGYRSVSLFSIEFQQRFHIKPSAFLREHQNKG